MSSGPPPPGNAAAPRDCPTVRSLTHHMEKTHEASYRGPTTTTLFANRALGAAEPYQQSWHWLPRSTPNTAPFADRYDLAVQEREAGEAWQSAFDATKIEARRRTAGRALTERSDWECLRGRQP